MVNMYIADSVKSFFFLSIKLHREKRNGFCFNSKSNHLNKLYDDFERKKSGALSPVCEK